jgi:hypothetical protein
MLLHQLFINYKKAYDSVRGEVLYEYNILIELISAFTPIFRIQFSISDCHLVAMTIAIDRKSTNCDALPSTSHIRTIQCARFFFLLLLDVTALFLLQLLYNVG